MHQCLLIEWLGTLSWRKLRDATLLVQEMREDVYEEDVLAEIKKEGQAEITFDTQKVRQFQPVFFNIKFKDERFNDAAALERLLCHWTFPAGLDERTWKVCHYFDGHEPMTKPPDGAGADAGGGQDPPPGRATLIFSRKLNVYATIRGQQAYEAEEVPVPPLKKTIEIMSAKHAEWFGLGAEFLRFAIAFGVALAGLLTGALQQLEKLDIIPASIAIIGLGFGASAIKNLLTQSAAPAAPAVDPSTAKK